MKDTSVDEKQERQNRPHDEIDISHNPLSEFGSNENTISIYLNEGDEDKGADKFSSITSSKIRDFFSFVEPKISIPGGKSHLKSLSHTHIDNIGEHKETDLNRMNSEKIFEQKEVKLPQNEDLIEQKLETKELSDPSYVEFRAFDSAHHQMSSEGKKQSLKYEEGKEEVEFCMKRHSDLDDEYYEQSDRVHYEQSDARNSIDDTFQRESPKSSNRESTPEFYVNSDSNQEENLETTGENVIFMSPEIKSKKLELDSSKKNKRGENFVSQNFVSSNLSPDKKIDMLISYDKRNEETAESNMSKTLKEESKQATVHMLSFEYSKSKGIFKALHLT